MSGGASPWSIARARRWPSRADCATLVRAAFAAPPATAQTAPAIPIARELYEVDRLSAFFDVIQQDPVVRKAKLIAEADAYAEPSSEQQAAASVCTGGWLSFWSSGVTTSTT